MIKSCNECQVKCCKIGPGPYTKVSANDYLVRFQGSAKYNTMCEHFNEEDESCAVWGLAKLPFVCATYVCSRREFTKEELERIDATYELGKMAGLVTKSSTTQNERSTK